MINPYFNKDLSRLEVLTPQEYVQENSREKALAVARDYDWSKPKNSFKLEAQMNQDVIGCSGLCLVVRKKGEKTENSLTDHIIEN
ncbi:hypothetical protein TNCT_323241 [Trichonephila clavata]|uniref:Uncharacterized protein n=1 Tax=Trichonephila clavata TaxID=2740835 RepID=A0A8X6FV57_TRICU|nr:hypothetical protein TNCT_323241 [Trichonephila clavata]